MLQAPQLCHILTKTFSTHHTQCCLRTITSTSSKMVQQSEIAPSEGSDPATLTQQTTALVDDGSWKLCNAGKGLERTFKFKTFKTTWTFMNTVAEECKKQKHHPEWTNIYNRTHIRWTTHNPEGLSGKDISMAEFCDAAAREAGEVPTEPMEEMGKGEEWKGEARECCGGKM